MVYTLSWIIIKYIIIKSNTWLLWLSWMAQNLNILVFDPLAGPGKSISGFRSHPQRRHDLLLWSFSTAIQTKSIKLLIKQQDMMPNEYMPWQSYSCHSRFTTVNGSPQSLLYKNRFGHPTEPEPTQFITPWLGWITGTLGFYTQINFTQILLVE